MIAVETGLSTNDIVSMGYVLTKFTFTNEFTNNNVEHE
jgi:hypothetical protein